MVAQTPLPLSGASFEFDTGKVKWAGHDLQGKSVTDKILIVPDMLGFAGGDWALFALSQHYRTGPKAILCGEFNPFVAAGSILGRIPTVAMLPKELLTGIEDGDRIRIDTAKGIVQI